MEKHISNAIFYIFYVITVLLNVLVINSEAELPAGYLTSRKYTWTEAKDSCIMIGLLDKVQVTDIGNQLGWINAAVEYTPWVEYLKCNHVKPQYIAKEKSVPFGDQLLQCLQFCEEYRFIGLQQSKCACLSLSEISGDTMKSVCEPKEMTTCLEDQYALCANSSSEAFVIYKKVTINEDLQSGNCLNVFDYTGRTKLYQANPCESLFSPICTPEDSATVYSHSSSHVWIKSVNICSPDNLVSYDVYKSLKTSHNGRFWLGNTRRHSMQQLPDVNVNQTYCIAVRIRKDDHKVFSFVRPCNEEYQAICAYTDITSTMSVESPPGLESKESIDNVLLMALIITAVLAVSVLIVVIVLYRRRISLRSGHQQIPAQNNEVTYAQVNKPTKDRAPVIAGEPIRNNTADDTYDHMEHHRLSQNQILTESNYDIMQSVGNEELENDYDVTSGTDRPRQIVVDDTEEYSHVEGEVEYQELKDVST
ncbi:uncharacterized protein [Mytilus edulis]|uniref:uncharacterized protein n=1 Tax=Mytilus edulis TaxID=6550 RepID=UPI0039EFD7BA